MAVSANRLELLQIADAVAREKSIDKQVVIAAMEEAIQKAAKSRYGQDNEIKAEIDAKTGETRLHRLRLVVDKIENEATEITLDEAQIRNPAAQTGDLIAEPLPPIDFGLLAPICGISSASMTIESPILTSACMILPSGPGIRTHSSAPRAR